MDKLTNILYVLATSTLYGTSRSLLILLKNLDRGKYIPLVILNSRGPLVKEIEKLGIEVKIIPLKRWIIPLKIRNLIYIPFNLLLGIVNVLRLCYFIKRKQINIVQTFDSVAIEGAIAARLLRIPHVWRIAEIWHIDPNLNPIVGSRSAYKIIEFFSDKIVPVSSAVASYFPNFKNKDKFQIVHNAINITNSKVAKKSFSHKIPNWIDTPAVVGYVGALGEHKGTEDFIKAACLVKKVFHKSRFVIAGAGSQHYENKLNQLVNAESMENSIIFTGFRWDIRSVFEALDIFVLTSREEPFARVVVEAMSFGKPVVATNSGGTPEIVMHNVTGILVPPKNTNALAKAVIQLIENPAKAKKMGEEGEKRVREFFNAQKQAEIMEGIYSKLILKNYEGEKI